MNARAPNPPFSAGEYLSHGVRLRRRRWHWELDFVRFGGRLGSVEYGKDTLPSGIRSRYVDNNNGVRMHVLEGGFENHGRPCAVLLHGFPELAYTWRHQLLP